MTLALAKSNNQYFSALGTRLGYERVVKYAQDDGHRRKGRHWISKASSPAQWPDAPPKAGGMGLMTAFGEGFLMTPLELAGILSSIANGGTLYYLQYPRSEAEIESFAPRVKRTLDTRAQRNLKISSVGMRGAVDYGTAAARNVRSHRVALRQDRHLHRFPRWSPHGMVRIVHRSRQRQWWRS